MGTVIIPAEHLIYGATGATPVIVAENAVNQTTTLYTVPANKSAYWTDLILAIKSTSDDFQLVLIEFTDDSESAAYDYYFWVAPWDTFNVQISLKRAVKMDEDDTLTIISPDAKVNVYATAHILLAV
jgi:hypothetical protein